MNQNGKGQRKGLISLIGLLGVAFFVAQIVMAGRGDGVANVPPTEAIAETVLEETAVTPTNSVDTAVSSQINSSIPLSSLPTINDSGLVQNPNPRTYQAKLPNHNFQIHVVSRGETPNVIADQYSISSETLLGGNPWLSQESNSLQAGAELVILPVDGVLHEVQPGETLASISESYQIPVEDIVAYPSNNLEAPFYRLVPESQILIPGAQIGQFYWTAPKTVAGSGNQNWQIIGTGSFIWPVVGRCLTQFYWFGHPGIDVGLAEGSAVVAADHGTVTYASWAAGTYFDYGNLIVLNHGNGYETLYAHLSNINVYPGQLVRQGEFIGSTGNTGRSSGPHIHFEIRLNDFRDDPLFYLGGGAQSCG